MSNHNPPAQTIKKTNSQRNVHPEVTYDNYDTIFYLLYFIGRYLVLLTSYFLCTICILYAIGSIVTLEATNFFCPSYTEAQVRQHNLENGFNEGDSPWSCWYIEQRRLNYESLFELDIGIFTGRIANITFVTILQSLVYTLVALILLIPTIYHSYLLLYDTFFAIRSYAFDTEANIRIHRCLTKLNRKASKRNVVAGNPAAASADGTSETQKEQTLSTTNSNANSKTGICNNCCRMIGNCIRRFNKWYFEFVLPVYYVDSKWRMLSIIGREWIEIAIQFYALLLYGGINLFNPNSNVLSQEPFVIEAFAVIVAANCIFGMLCGFLIAIQIGIRARIVLFLFGCFRFLD